MTMSDILQYDGLVYWNPLGAQRIEHVLDLMSLEADDRVLEIGCGRAELALRLVERFGVRATIVDRSQHALDLARAAIAQRTPGAAFEVVCRDAREFSGQTGEFAAIACVGGPRVAGDLRESWRTLLDWLRPGGWLLAGEGFWQQTPDADYLAATGIPEDELYRHWEHIALAREFGATVLFSCVSSRAEWDEFEGRIMFNVERHAARHPDDPEVAAMLARRRTFYDAQQRWGRGTMGFALYLLRKP
jgi:SAM-dependent methyltransferase